MWGLHWINKCKVIAVPQSTEFCINAVGITLSLLTICCKIHTMNPILAQDKKHSLDQELRPHVHASAVSSLIYPFSSCS